MAPGTFIRICENPRVLEAAADAACTQPLVCTSGSASTVVLTLLDALAATECRFAYHADLAPTMEALSIALHEEATLDLLVDDLR